MDWCTIFFYCKSGVLDNSAFFDKILIRDDVNNMNTNIDYNNLEYLKTNKGQNNVGPRMSEFASHFGKVKNVDDIAKYQL